MLGIFGTLDMAARSMAAEQVAMTVAGNNMANANNPAYAEEQANIQPSTPLDLPDGQEGTGVVVNGITEIRNSLLDSQITAEASVTGSYSAQQTALQGAEAYLGEQLSSTSTGASSTDGLAAGLSSLFDSFSSLATNPSDLASRQTVINNAQQLAGRFNQVSSYLSQTQSGLNQSVSNDTASANQDLSQIASLNNQIALAQSAGESPNELIDTREATVESLAGLANITTSTQADGSVNVSIGGVAMVTGWNAVNSLQNYTDSAGNTQVEDANSSTPLTITGGSIGGNISARDGALASLQSSVNTLAGQIITSVNNIYSAGYDLHGGTGQALFTGSGAADMGVNAAVVNDPSLLQVSGTSGDAGDNTIALSLAALNEPTGAGQTFSENYAQTVAALGNAISTVNDQLSTSQTVSATLTNQRSSVSGVNIDTEMTNLLQYQKAYEASAQMVSMLDNMLSAAIGMDATP